MSAQPFGRFPLPFEISFPCSCLKLRKFLITLCKVKKRLLTLCKGTQSLATYTVEFKLLAAESRWKEMALQGAFIQELSDEIKDELAIMDVTDCLGAHISLAIRLDKPP